MNAETARALEIGDRLVWKADGARGTVTDKGYAGVTITWEDGKGGMFLFREKKTPWHMIEFFEEKR